MARHVSPGASTDVDVTEPKGDARLARISANDEKPQDGQFDARDYKKEGTLHYSGTLADPAASITPPNLRQPTYADSTKDMLYIITLHRAPAGSFSWRKDVINSRRCKVVFAPSLMLWERLG